ncbi:signal peptide peptidase SppA [Stratiformator vulcanicus]|uniref:Signal peptide peptidase SppA n=1 Tax=Stratiformator vulcanicus TaxID=2527980 RepID=A0A517R3G9_9PLAN|nr:signal peptide peptidase SppA [Stratiformator vulcanicus]QDT38438.1 Putative signal peptide peptidase SppA [Stratiformator vulcanicus]
MSSLPTADSRPAKPPRKKRKSSWAARLLLLLLICSIGANAFMYSQYEEYFQFNSQPKESFRDGDADSDDKIAVIEIGGTIMPPVTEQTIDSIEKAKDDAAVKGVILSVDSPGGIVADSHQIYHALKELSAIKPVYVSMKRLAASGGYYVSMGIGEQGRIFAEPTTWTGSIGVIIPRYDMTELGSKIGVQADAIKTGKFKDSLNPLRPLTQEEVELWNAIIDDSFDLFVKVIVDNRPGLDEAKVRELATGQVYTANQALEAGLVDEIGFEDAAVKALEAKLGLSNTRIVTYTHPADWSAAISLIQARDHRAEILETFLNAGVPRAYYLFSSLTPASVGD